jgi:hypothetical protein
MYVGETVIEKKFTRKSKNGAEHSYFRKQRIVNLKCDNCGSQFTRPRGSMDPKRLSNNYFHCCKTCDAKKFAQKRSVQKNYKWKLTASSKLPVGRL